MSADEVPPVPGLRVDLLYARAAAVDEGVVHALGLGLLRVPRKPRFAVIILIEAPWRAAEHHYFGSLDLVDPDGHAIDLPLVGKVSIGFDFQVEPAVDTPVPGATRAVTPIAIEFDPKSILPLGRFMFRVTIDGETHEHWQRAFDVIEPD